MKVNLLLCAGLLGLLSVLSSCEDHQNSQQPQPRYRLKTLRSTSPAQEFTFTYDAQGRIASYLLRSITQHTEQAFVYQYANSNRLVRIDGSSERYTYTYDADNRLASASQYLRNQLYMTYEYAYDNTSAFPVNLRWKPGPSYLFPNDTFTFTYVYAGGNIVSTRRDNESPGTSFYDDKPNPYVSLTVGLPDRINFNKNNFLGGAIANTYDNNGLLIKKIIDPRERNPLVTEFAYEAY